MRITLTTDQQVKLTLAPKAPNGLPIPLQSTPAWTVVNGDVKLSVSNDGLSCVIASGDNPGKAEVLVTTTGDVDLDKTDVIMSEAIYLTVLGSREISLGLNAEIPTPKSE